MTQDSGPAAKTLHALKVLDLGNSVAEFDEALERYFVETEAFRLLSSGAIDVVAGDKGTGKTALFRILQKRYPTIPEMANVEVVPAFNIQGNPIFQRINEDPPLQEGQYGTLWKAYFLSLAGNWLLRLWEDARTDKMFELQELLDDTGLLSADDAPSTVFSSVINLFKRLRNPKAAEGAISITPEGLPIITGRVDFADSTEPHLYVSHDRALGVLNAALEEVDLHLWLIMDRLDEAFAGLPAAEIPALRALLRTYLDLSPYDHLKLKLFLRKDLFRRIVGDAFVNLTHVNARKHEIMWDEDSLQHLLSLRLRDNTAFLDAADLTDASEGDMFARLFPEQVDPGDRKPGTWTWMMSRVRDANDVKPPRNLIDLISKSRDAAIRREERLGSDFDRNSPLLPSDALKDGLRALSKQRVEDTLLAEAGEQGQLIERFRNGKAEHNSKSLEAQLGLKGAELDTALQFLRDIGFLELTGSTYKVPMLYRDGLSITQGKAF